MKLPAPSPVPWLLLIPLGVAAVALNNGTIAAKLGVALSCAAILALGALRGEVPGRDAVWLVLGLLFSACGDWFLSNRGGRESYFITGIGLFFFAHVCFLAFCLRHGRVSVSVLALLCLGYVSYFIFWLRPAITGIPLLLAVLLYLLLSCVVLSAAWGLRLPMEARAAFIGGISLIVFSDTLISLKEFLGVQAGTGLILPTYYLAHLCLTWSVLRMSGLGFGVRGLALPQRRAWVALLLLVPFPSLGTAAAMFWWPGTSLGYGVFLFSKIWVVLLPLVWLLRVERGHLSWSPARQGGFGAGILLGVLVGGLIVLAYTAARSWGWLDPVQIAERARQTGLSNPMTYIAGAFYWVTINSLMEEYVWRWFCFRHCETLFGPWWGVLASALAFTLHHIIALAGQFSPGITAAASLGVFIGGAAWSWLYLRYRSIWPPYVSHAIVDLPIFVLGYLLIFS